MLACSTHCVSCVHTRHVPARSTELNFLLTSPTPHHNPPTHAPHPRTQHTLTPAGNIWTHMLPALLLLALLAGGQLQAWQGARVAFLLNVGSIAACFLGSVAFHTFMAHHHHYHQWLCLDVSGGDGVAGWPGKGMAGSGARCAVHERWMRPTCRAADPAAANGCMPPGCLAVQLPAGRGSIMAPHAPAQDLLPRECVCLRKRTLSLSHAAHCLQVCGVLLVLVGGGHMVLWW